MSKKFTASWRISAGDNVTSLRLSSLTWPDGVNYLLISVGDDELVLRPARFVVSGAAKIVEHKRHKYLRVVWPRAEDIGPLCAVSGYVDERGALHVAFPDGIAGFGLDAARLRMRLPICRRGSVAWHRAVSAAALRRNKTHARVAKPVDAPDLKSGGRERLAGSTPAVGTRRQAQGRGGAAVARVGGRHEFAGSIPAPATNSVRTAPSDRELIDAAIAAGNVTKLPTGILRCNVSIGPGRRCSNPPRPGMETCAEHATWRQQRAAYRKGNVGNG